MKDRKDKIEFLKGLARGQRSIAELLPPRDECIFIEQEDPELYLCHETGQIMTREYIDKHFNRGVISIVKLKDKPDTFLISKERSPFRNTNGNFRIVVYVQDLETALNIKNL